MVPFHPVSAVDYLPQPQLAALQLQRLRAVVRREYDNVPLFRERMRKRGLEPGDVTTLSDLAKLPFMQKTDLRDTYPFGLFTCPMSEIVRLHASSGTTGKPIVVGYTQNDLKVWAECIARCFAAFGMTRGDIIQNSYGYGLFTGGLGAHYGAEALGMTVVPASGGNTDRQIMLLKDFGVTAVCCTPSYFLHLCERAGEMGVDMKALPLRVGAFGAEPWTEALRLRIQEMAGIRAHDIYGLSEVIGPGVACECQEQCGLHVLEGHFYPEIVNPETGEPLPDGEEGELVFTTLDKEAMPVIRYRTHDITSLSTEKCACGRTLRKMNRVKLRTDDMLVIRGVNVFPSQIETALMEAQGTLPHYQILLTRHHGLDQITIQVEVTPELFGDTVGSLERLRSHLAHAIDHTLGIRAAIELVEPHTIARSEGKAKRVIDRRLEDEEPSK